jgi:hypothetical protein
VTDPVDPPDPPAFDPDPVGWRRIARSRSARVFVVLALLASLGRLVAIAATARVGLEAAAAALVGGIISAVQVVLPAVLLALPRRGRGRVDVMLVGFVLIASSQLAWTLAGAAFALAIRTGVSISGFYSLISIVGPAVAITAAVGGVLIPFGLARRINGRAGTSKGAVGCVATALWLILAGTIFLQYASAYSASPTAFGTIAIAFVAALGWIATGLVAARHRSGSPRSLGPLAIGAALIAIGNGLETGITNLIAADPFRYRDAWRLVATIGDWLLIFVGWLLVLLAAVRGLPAGSSENADPLGPDPAATMSDP